MDGLEGKIARFEYYFRPAESAIAGTGAGDVREGLQAERVALGNDQPLRAPRKADDFVQARLQQRFVGACSQ